MSRQNINSHPDSPAWTEETLANPHAANDKRARVQQMFAAIAPTYDLNNRLHSGWIDQYWRRRSVRLADLKVTDHVVDVACGTGDLAIAFGQRLFRLSKMWCGSVHGYPEPGYVQRADWSQGVGGVVGIDFTFQMLPIADAKATCSHVMMKGPTSLTTLAGNVPIIFLAGDAQALPLPDACADVVSIAFGIRNVQDPLAALKEFRRVLRPNGRVIVLEFSIPTNPLIRALYDLYCTKIMPKTATWISRDKSGAYKYLPHSVATFLTRGQMMDALAEAGFTNITATPLTFGTVVVYRGFVAGSACG